MTLRGSGFTVVVVILLALSIFFPMVEFSSNEAEAQGEPVATLAHDMVYLIQGPSATYPQLARSDINVVKLISYVLPHNLSRVYSQVPHDARNISILNDESPSVGWETEGAMAGMFYYDVPSSFPRNDTYNHTEAAVELPEVDLVNASYSDGSIHLDANATTAICTSSEIPIAGAYGITSANISVFGANLTNVSAWISNDAGSTWVPAAGTGPVQFSTEGVTLKVRLVLQGNVSSGGDPKVTGFRVQADYVPLATILTLHISYIITPDYADGHALINLTEPTLYSDSGMFFVFAYVEDGYRLEGRGIGLILGNPDASYPGRQLYFNMTYLTGQPGPVFVELFAPQKSVPSWAMIVGAGSVVFIVGLMFVYLRKRGQDRIDESATSAGEQKEIRPLIREERKALRSELVARKKQLLDEMDRLRTGDSKGNAPRLAELKREFKGVRNELNRLEVEDASSGTRDVKDEYDVTMAMLSRIDDDFERGLLPKGSHETLRKKYLAEATRLKQELESGSKGLDDEKVKLMKAIVDLEEERDKGAIDSKVFEELNASYRKELEGVIRQMEEGADAE